MTLARAYVSPPRDSDEVEQRVRSHMQLVRKIAWQIHGRVRDIFEIDDLVQIGMLSLVEAAKRFEDVGQASFTSYAAVRIRGALTDHLRKNLTLTRLGVQRRSQIEVAEQAVKAAGGDPSNLELVATELGITVAELQSWRDKASSSPNKSLDEIYDDHSIWFADDGHTPESAMVADELRGKLAFHLKRLKEREALVLQLYYVEELNLEEISEVLEVTVGRVSQLKKSALAQLREWMQSEIE
jgi:RNA polymerase sigma factor for flagellar operon FliA